MGVEKRRCFIIGPMRDDPDEQGKRWLQRLASHIDDLLSELGLANQYRIITPWDHAGGQSIMNDVISEIDRADFIIADLTGSNPNVLYELALVDSLGKPCLTIGEEPPFDRKGFRHIFLKQNTFATGDIRTSLLNSLRAINEMISSPDMKIPENPITLYYGAPLVGVSSTVALAQAYFNNFVKVIVEQLLAVNNANTLHINTIGFLTNDDNDNPLLENFGKSKKERRDTKLFIVVPDDIDYVNFGFINRLRGNEDNELQTAYISTPHRFFTVLARRTTERSFHMVDFPTPMNGLLKTIQRRVRGLDRENRNTAEWRELEKEETSRFYTTLEILINSNKAILQGKVELVWLETSMLQLNRRAVAQIDNGKYLWLYDLISGKE